MKTISGNAYLKKERGKLLVDLIPIDDILKKSPTPFMIFLENKIRENINSFKNIFGAIFKNLECFYSFKANFLPEICKIINSEGIGAELVALPELKLALHLEFPSNKILMGGPYLPENLIELSIQNKIKEIIIYNLKDLEFIDKIAKKYNINQDICLRVNSKKFDSKLGIILDDTHIQFLKTNMEKFQNLRIKTILSHHTTQMNNFEQYEQNVTNIIDNFNKLRKNGINVENINLGGGFPEATIMPAHQLEAIAFNIKNILDASEINYKKIYLEPGRYFVGDSGVFIADIVDIKDDWIFLNIGNHICPKFARCSLRFYNVSRINDPHKFKTSIAGIIPTDQDVLAKNYFFTEIVKLGDKILITNVGSYALTFSNRFPYTLPNIYLVKNNIIHQIFNPTMDRDFSIF
jgi:diaminopimelate decarboxylase